MIKVKRIHFSFVNPVELFKFIRIKEISKEEKFQCHVSAKILKILFGQTKKNAKKNHFQNAYYYLFVCLQNDAFC